MDDDAAADMEAREVRALARLGIADPYAARALMASEPDEDGGSRLWRGMRHLIFGDEAEPTLRDQIEEAIEEAEESAPGGRRPHARPSGRCCAICSTSATAPRATSASRAATSSRCRNTISFEELVEAFADAGHSRLPVYGDGLDEVVGMVHIKDVFMANVDASRDRSLRRADARALVRARIDGRDRIAGADAQPSASTWRSSSTNSAAPRGW